MLHQFPFEHVTLKHKQVGDYNYMNSGVVASLVIVVIVSGNLFVFFFFKLHKYNKIQYVAVTQNINTILYDCTLLNLQINMLTTYLNVNFNKMLESFIFQRSYAQYLY